MRFVQPSDRIRPSDRSGSFRPQWLKQWIAEQPKYVLLGCGHKDDSSIPSTILRGFLQGNVEMFCERCESFQPMRKISLHEYANITAIPIPDEPMF